MAIWLKRLTGYAPSIMDNLLWIIVLLNLSCFLFTTLLYDSAFSSEYLLHRNKP